MNTLSFHLPLIKYSLGIERRTISRIILVVVICLILPLLAFYLFQVGELIRGNYLLKEEQIKVEKLSGENLILQSQISNLFSLNSIEEQIKAENFVSVVEVKYIPLADDYLANTARTNVVFSQKGQGTASRGAEF